MPTYALLGATGSTGSAVLRCLLSEPPKYLKLNVLVRSKSKLLKAFQRLEETSALVLCIIEGLSTDAAALHRGLEDADVVIMCVGQNESQPGMSLSYDTAAAIIDTLKTLRQSRGSSYRTPTILQLRSASLNPNLAQQAPWLVRRIVSFCLHYEYVDIQCACHLYEFAAKESPAGLLEYIFVDPPTIHDTGGTNRTGYKLISTENQSPSLSYADLGAALCELAERKADFRSQGVGVSATGTVKETWSTLLGYLVYGAKNRILAWMGF